MNTPDDADLESRLARLHPAGLPDDLSYRLHAAEPLPPPASEGGGRRAGAVVFLRGAVAGFLRPWPLAYSGLLAAWLLILGLRLATPPAPAGVADYQPGAQIVPVAAPFPASIGGYAVDHAALLTRNNLSDPWP